MGLSESKYRPQQDYREIFSRRGMTDETFKKKKEVFNEYKDEDEKITPRMLQKMVKLNNPCRGTSILPIVPQLYKAYDQDKDKVIGFEDYLMIEAVFSSKDLPAAVDLIFEVMDVNGDGFLDKKEVSKMIMFLYKSLVATKMLSQEEVANELFKEIDKNKDGKISKEEFLETLKEKDKHPITKQLFRALMKQFV